jgi:peptidoglycan/xylan/chitin deacetylase (PgdA/CDA1 family)
MFPCLSPKELETELKDTQRAIAQICGVAEEQLRDVRPPNGVFTPKTLQFLQQWHYRPVMWSVVPEDWVRPGVNTVIDRVLTQTRPGSLIVLHDGYFGGQDVVETVACLIPLLKQRGYQFVTVGDLWQARGGM